MREIETSYPRFDGDLVAYPRILEAEARELARIESLRAAFGDDPEFADHAIDCGWSEHQARRWYDEHVTDQFSGPADRNASQHGVGCGGQAGRDGRVAGAEFSPKNACSP